MIGATVAPIEFEKKVPSVSRGLRLPEDLDARVCRVARSEGVSVNQALVALLRAAVEQWEREHRKPT